ncbi:MAG: hypothetical protein LBR46_08560 [Prevotella sp.]|nr:hypothetical protein [Prevotella sp.]
MPRVNLSKNNQLYPMYESDVNGEYKIGNIKYTKADEDKKHIGLVVYNVATVSAEGLEVGVHSWDGDQWVAVKSGGGSGTTYSGGYPIVVKNDNIYLATTEEKSSTPLTNGSILKFDGTTWKVVVPVDNDTQYTGSASIAVDASTNVISVKDNGVTTDKIKDANVTPEKIEGGTDGQVLTTDASGNAVWAALKSSEGPLTPDNDGNYYLEGGSGAYIVATVNYVTPSTTSFTIKGNRLTSKYSQASNDSNFININEIYGTNANQGYSSGGQSGIPAVYIIPVEKVTVTPSVSIVVVKL